jgi:hypothetical protein
VDNEKSMLCRFAHFCPFPFGPSGKLYLSSLSAGMVMRRRMLFVLPDGIPNAAGKGSIFIGDGVLTHGLV